MFCINTCASWEQDTEMRYRRAPFHSVLGSCSSTPEISANAGTVGRYMVRKSHMPPWPSVRQTHTPSNTPPSRVTLLTPHFISLTMYHTQYHLPHTITVHVYMYFLQILHSLNRTYINLKMKPVWQDLNPKAITTDELYGLINKRMEGWTVLNYHERHV